MSGQRIERRIVGFVHLLRHNGFALGVEETLDALRVARAVDLERPEALRWGLRALLASTEDEWRRFDELFDLHWRGRGVKQAVRSRGSGAGAFRGRKLGDAPPGAPALADRVTRGDDGDASVGGEGKRQGASRAEALGSTDLRHINDPEELAQVARLAERLARRMQHRLSRRERVTRQGRRLDLRKTIHQSVRYGGTPMQIAFRARRREQLRLVLLVDVSGSMSLYSTFFMRFVRGLVDRFRVAEAFVFHTRLVPVSPALRERDLARALDRMSLIAAGWSGGTRIGESLAAFNRHYAADVLNSRSIVIIMSDGYDTGEPAALAAELRQLRRRARRIVWLNPLLGWESYEPTAGGMAAALPYIDLFAPAHNLDSLAALEPELARL
ncbi:MAG TPA: VWA domain-containing protein [Stellaceae bacterium]|jgi:uncharacterized protein with von Willebrand factor type A (vWA) domain|nr:VWA domain-containing protein [Stellaceae bacterium]